MKLRKTSQGNYTGWHEGFYLFFFKRPHGYWSCIIRKNWIFWSVEGYFTTSLRTLTIAKAWAKTKIKNNESFNK